VLKTLVEEDFTLRCIYKVIKHCEAREDTLDIRVKGHVLSSSFSRSYCRVGRKFISCSILHTLLLCCRLLINAHTFTRNTLDCDQSNVYSSRAVFSAISQGLFRSSSI